MNRRLLLKSFVALASAPGLSTGRAWAQASTPAPNRRGRPEIVTYGPDPRQALDMYPGAAETPILLFVHGGGWAHGDRSGVNALPDYALRHGLTLASTDYRLAPQVTAREAAQDVAAAVAAVKRARPGRPVVLAGHSAGAHLAALVATDPLYLGAHGLTPSDLAGVILLDGAGYDATAARGGRGAVNRMLERMYDQAFGDDRAELSPILRVRSGVAYPPFLIFHVARRQDSAEQSRALAEALRRVGGRAEVIAAPGDSHADINREFGVAGDAEGERAARFIAAESRRFLSAAVGRRDSQGG